MAKIKAILDALFNSPYLDKADVAAVVTAVVILYQLHLTPAQQDASVLLLSVAYVVAHKIENALSSK